MGGINIRIVLITPRSRERTEMVTVPVGAGPLEAVTSPLMVMGCPGFGFGGFTCAVMLTMLVGGGVVEARAVVVEEVAGVDDCCAGVVDGVLEGAAGFVLVGRGVVEDI